MKPSTADIIDSIIWSLDAYVAPEVQAPFASSVLLTVGNLLRHVKLRAQHEAEMLMEDNSDLIGVMRAAAERLGSDTRISHVLKQPLAELVTTLDRLPKDIGSPRSSEALSDDSDVLRQALDNLIHELGALAPALQTGESYLETRQQIRSYLARQLKREGSLITPAFTGGRR